MTYKIKNMFSDPAIAKAAVYPLSRATTPPVQNIQFYARKVLILAHRQLIHSRMVAVGLLKTAISNVKRHKRRNKGDFQPEGPSSTLYSSLKITPCNRIKPKTPFDKSAAEARYNMLQASRRSDVLEMFWLYMPEKETARTRS